MQKQILKGHLAILIASIIFGLNIPVMTDVLQYNQMTPFTVTLLRICGATILFWIISLAQKNEKVTIRDLALLFLAAILVVVINMGLFAFALEITSPTNVAISATFLPIVTMLLAAMFMKEPITWTKATGVLIGATGVGFLIASSMKDGQSGSLLGMGLCLISVLAYAIYLTAFKSLIMKYSASTIMKWMFLFGTICCLPFGYKEMISVDYMSIPLDIYIKLIFVIFGSTFIAYLLVPESQKYLRPTVVSMYNYVQPIVTALAVFLTGMEDSFGWMKAISVVFVFSGVYIVTRSKSRAQLEEGRYRK